MGRGLQRVRRIARRFRADQRGNISILFSAFMVASMVAGAFAIDEGALNLQRRTAQATVDLAAIEAASNPGAAFDIARQAFVDAGLVSATATRTELENPAATTRLAVTTGSYVADPSIAAGQRFQPNTTAINAVRVKFAMRGALYLAQSWSKPPEIAVTATGSATPTIAFSIGSSLLTLQDGISNAVLNGLLGANVGLGAVSYNGLLSTRINLFRFLDALAQEFNITAGTYQDVLDASADQGMIAKAIADVVTGADASAALTLAAALGHNGRVPLSRLFDLGDAGRLALGTGASSGYLATVSALQMLTATAALSDGTHQVSLNLLTGIPGLASLTMTLAVGEPQQSASWFALGPSGTLVETAQVRLRFIATLGGGPALLGASVHVPLYLELAYAQAGVASASCPAAGASTGTAVINAQPGVARLLLGEVGDPAFGNFGNSPSIGSATLINLLLLKVSGIGIADIGQTTPIPLAFSASDITSGTVKRAGTSTFTQSLTTSLLAHTSFSISALGLGLSTGSVTAALNGVLAPPGPVVDGAIGSALAALGLSLGNADVTVYGVTCTRPVLVQ